MGVHFLLQHWYVALSQGRPSIRIWRFCVVKPPSDPVARGRLDISRLQATRRMASQVCGVLVAWEVRWKPASFELEDCTSVGSLLTRLQWPS